jgi:hypothetical protein
MMPTQPKRPTAEEALQILKDGNKRFISGKLEHPNHCEESRKSLTTGQEPIATVLTCAVTNHRVSRKSCGYHRICKRLWGAGDARHRPVQRTPCT